MKRMWQSLGIVAGLFAAASIPALAQTARKGSEFRVNSYTTGYQEHATASYDGSGNFVVVWETPDGSREGVVGRRFDSAGNRLGTDFTVNTYTTSYQSYPAVSSDSTGNFVVAWQSFGQDGSYYGVFGQRFSSTGAPAGSEFFVNTTTTYDQLGASIGRDGSGNFVVVWEGPTSTADGIFGQRFSNVGVTQGNQFQVSSYNNSYKGYADVARNGTGDFVVAWESFAQDGSDYGVFGQRYKPTGQKNGQEFQINTYTTGAQGIPSVAIDSTGNFIVAWQSAQDGSGTGIYAQRYNSAGAKVGGEFRVNTYTTGNQKRPSIAADGSGNFVVVWQSAGQDGSGYGIFGQRFTSAGAARGTEFPVNAYTTANQVFPSVTVSPSNSDFLVVWDSWGQDRSLTGVYGQRFGMSNCALPAVTAPASQAACIGASVFLTVTPSGLSPFTYQWRKNGINLVDGVNVKGSTAATLKISPFGAGDAGSYDCVVTDYCLPPASVTSAAATLTATTSTAPSPVTGLVVQKINNRTNLKLTWNNGTNATSYVVFEDTSPSGAFTTQSATATSGLTGVTLPMPVGDRYYLVAGRNNACGIGPQD